MRLSFLGLALVACGPAELIDQLADLPNVHDVTEMPTLTEGYRYFVIHFEQPVDHADAAGPKFLQLVSLIHKDSDAPMIEWTSGYWDYYHDGAVELTQLLGANQVSIEHRYFGASRPDPADWSKLTIEQMAADQHAITLALRNIYNGAFIASGGSKGGMTASYYSRFYPDDVEGTVPYVAPISFGAPDPRYVPFLDAIGTPECRQAVRDVATEMLANRRAALLLRAQDQAVANGFVYTRIPIEPGLESSVFNLEWTFWQYYGLGACPMVPLPTATDDALFKFLDDISPVADNRDERIAQFEPYVFQAYFQLGYPDGGAVYLDPYLMYTEADYLSALPTARPAYDGGAAMLDIDDFVRTRGENFLFIYGEWDPWTGGQYELGEARDSLRLVQPRGTHGARITRLDAADRDAAFAKLEAWTGVRPAIPMARSAREDRELQLPSAVMRALRVRQLSP